MVETDVEVTGVSLNVFPNDVSVEGDANVEVSQVPITLTVNHGAAYGWTEVDSSNTTDWIKVQ